MRRLVSTIIFLVGITLFTFFVIVFTTEHTNIISHLYKDKIVKTVENENILRINFDELNIKWKGLYPQLIFNQISIYDAETSNAILKSESLIIEIDSIKSLKSKMIILKEIDFIKTDLNIIFDSNKLVLNEFDLSKIFDDSKNNIMSQSRVRISQSKLSLNYFSNVYSFDNISLVLLKKKDDYKIFSTFTHNDDNQLVHIAANLRNDTNNRISGSFFSQGVNISIDHNFKNKKLKFKGNKVNYEVWLSINNNKITSMNGSMSFDDLNVYTSSSRNPFAISESKFDYMYLRHKQEKYISIDNIDIQINNKKYVENKLLIKLNEENIKDIFVKEIDYITAKDILMHTNLKFDKNLNQVLSRVKSALFSNLSIKEIDNYKKLSYSLDFKSLGASFFKGYYIENLSGHMFGGVQESYINIQSKDIQIGDNSGNANTYDSLNANFLLKTKNSGYIIKTDTIDLTNNFKIKLNAYFDSNTYRYATRLSGSLNSLITDKLFNIAFKNHTNHFDLNSNFLVDYNEFFIGKNKYNFGKISLSDLSFKLKDYSVFGSSDKISINFLNGYLISKSTKINLNNDEYNLKILTKKKNNSREYITQATGKISANSLRKIKLLNEYDYIDGEALSKLSLKIKNSDSGSNVSVTLSSNMEGMSINLFKPFEKNANEKKYLLIKYNLTNNPKKYIDVSYQDYEMRIYNEINTTYMNISSPSLQGSLVIPGQLSKEDPLIAKLQYFDLSDFQGSSDPKIYPDMNISINRARIGDYIFNNMRLSSSKSRDGMTLDHLSFQNQDLSMNASGKWVNISGKQVTFFEGNFSSSNFGKSLKQLGYGDIIKRGKLNSKMIGQWSGSPDLFAFENFDGSIKLSLDDGEFLQVKKETKVIGQLLGLFSIASLQKRLSLDFSDFFSTGLSFDEMNGEFLFEESIANVNNLNLVGTFGEMNISGSSNIREQTHDQKLTYIPDLSSMSLISGTLLGGPIGAVASIFYDKVLKEIGFDTNELAAVEYTIKGSWKNPEINLVETFKPIRN